MLYDSTDVLESSGEFGEDYEDEDTGLLPTTERGMFYVRVYICNNV